MDKYTKVILTVIAILLAGNMLVLYQGLNEIANEVNNVRDVVSDVASNVDSVSMQLHYLDD